jgi:hypothetical protein
MSQYRWIALGFASVLFLAGMTNYVPGLTDDDGKAFGIFSLDIFDDLLHFASAAWALTAAFLSRRASVIFLKTFGTLYFADGLLGLITGSGYLDLGIVRYGVVPQPVLLRILANLPHLVLGGFAMLSGFLLPRWRPN